MICGLLCLPLVLQTDGQCTRTPPDNNEGHQKHGSEVVQLL